QRLDHCPRGGVRRTIPQLALKQENAPRLLDAGLAHNGLIRDGFFHPQYSPKRAVRRYIACRRIAEWAVQFPALRRPLRRRRACGASSSCQLSARLQRTANPSSCATSLRASIADRVAASGGPNLSLPSKRSMRRASSARPSRRPLRTISWYVTDSSIPRTSSNRARANAVEYLRPRST